MRLVELSNTHGWSRRALEKVRRIRPVLCLGAIAWVVAGCIRTTGGEDRVTVSPARPGAAAATIKGEILDYRGSGLRIRLNNGRDELIDSARVVEITTEWPPGLVLGEAAWRAGQWDDALTQYRSAAASEKRGWVKRRLLARLVECLRDARRVGDAGDAFLALYRADEDTPYFGAIPLDWTNNAVDAAAVETRARQWLKQDAVSPAVLIGASWLLTRSDRNSAIAALRRLRNETDRRVALMAEVQLWRTQVVSASRDELRRWHAQLERTPAELRPGPTFLLGHAEARHDDPESAALHWLRIPILWNDHRELSALALWESARQLERTAHPQDSIPLYHEIVATYPASSVAETAARRLAHPPAADSAPSSSTP